jgi:hypothetical protein
VGGRRACRHLHSREGRERRRALARGRVGGRCASTTGAEGIL